MADGILLPICVDEKLARRRARQRTNQQRYRERHRERVITSRHKYESAHKDQIHQRRQERIARDPEAHKEKVMAWRLQNLNARRLTARAYRKKNLDKHRKAEQKRRALHPERTKQIKAICDKKRHERLKHDPAYQLVSKLRKRLCQAIRQGTKGGSAVIDLGCSIETFRSYIEALFLAGMTWENWGRGPDKWHLDHIKPLSAFDLTARHQFLEACHFSNYQPLWQGDNVRKGGIRRSNL